MRCRALAHDAAEGFRKHCLDLLCLCELGEHEIGLQGRKNLCCNTQNDLLELVVEWANDELDAIPISLPARTTTTLNCRWMGEPIKITNCHCPLQQHVPGI